MNVSSYHQQQQQLLQFNLQQHQPSLPASLNENDSSKMNHYNNGPQKYPPQENANSLHNSMAPPSVDQLSQHVNKMSVQDNGIGPYPHPQYSSLSADQNKNMTNNDHLYNQQNTYAQSPPRNTYQWNQPPQQSAPMYPNNNVQPPPFPPSKGPQMPLNHSTPTSPPSMYPGAPPSIHNNGLPPPMPPPQSTFAQYNQKLAFPPPMNAAAPGARPPGLPHPHPNDQVNLMSQQPYQMTAHSNPYGQQPQSYPQSYSHQEPQPQRKLDPDNMPNPIQVMEEDRELRGNDPFITNQAGQVPPLVTTSFVVQDEGNASPRYMRSSMYNVPCNTDMMKQADIPFSLVITPLATLAPEERLPFVVNTGEFGPVRCVRCKAYVNPYMKFIDGGRRFMCNLCKAVTEVPAEYFQHLDHTGNRVDRYERPELLYGAYEFTVTKEYCKDNEIPNVPALIFIIDVSYNNVKSGMVKLLCEQMTDIVQNYMPTDELNDDSPRMRVGFITYDTTVHFYNIKACLGQPQMMIVGDMEDVFVPLLDGFLCDPVESMTVINSLMQQIPATFADTRETDTILLPAIQAGLEALKAAKCAGKLLVFNSSLPTGNAPGKLVNREDRKLLGTEKEKIVLTPQNAAYTSLAQECVNAGCSVDLYIFNNSHIDLATIGQISKVTGGEVFKYTYFQADLDGERLIEDVKRNISRQIAFDAVMRVRTSTGVRPVSFYGHMHMSTTTDIELASINSDKSIAVEVKHDDKLAEEDGVFIQVALLYTASSGQRRVRLLNQALKCCSQMAELFRNCELDTMINFWSKAAVTKLLEATPRQVKESLISKCARLLACYRKVCANPSPPGQLIIPECMKLLLLYTNCLLKSDAVSGGSDMTVDDRWYTMQRVLIMDIPSSVPYFYPRLIPLVDIDFYTDETPFPIRCTSYKISHSEAYILENGLHMFLWIGVQVPSEWIRNVLGVQDFSLINTNCNKIPALDNVHSKRINSVIDQIQKERRHTMKLTILREGDKMEIVFKHFLMEDGTGGPVGGDNLSSSSYVDFLCHMHKEIRSILS